MSGHFRTIVADPPWRYDNAATRNAAEQHLQADFYDQNEHRLYRYTGEHEGRTMYARLLNLAVVDGWEVAVARLLDRFKR